MLDSSLSGIDSSLTALIKRHFRVLEHEPVLEETMSLEEFDDLRAGLRNHIADALSSAAILSDIARRSYRHDNGFTKLVLIQAPDDISEVRLHIWERCAPTVSRIERAASNIHSHSSDFISLVLCGGLSEQIFEEESAACAPEYPRLSMMKYECGSREEREHYEMVYLYNSIVACKMEIEVRPMCLHGLRYDVLHRIEPAKDPTVTLFFQSKRRVSGTYVHSDPRRNWKADVASPNMRSERVAELFGWLIERNIV